jgi:hypothetical protein
MIFFLMSVFFGFGGGTSSSFSSGADPSKLSAFCSISTCSARALNAEVASLD